MFKKNLTYFSIIFFLFLTNLFIISTAIASKKSRLIYLHEQNIRSIEKSKLNNFIQNGNVIIIFYEDWCGPCKRMTPIFETLIEEINDIVFIKIKRSLYKELFNKFGLTTIPAMVFCKKGKIVHIRPKSATKEELIELIKTFF